MRVLMVAQFYPPTVGGEERAVSDLSVELARRGHTVTVATFWRDGLAELEEIDGVRVHRIRSTLSRFPRLYGDRMRRHAPPATDPEAMAALRRVVADERPQIVHGHNWLIHSYLPLRRVGGPRLVVSLHDHRLVCSNKRLIRDGEPCAGPGFQKCLACSSSYYGRVKGPALTVANWGMAVAERSVVDMFLPVSAAVARAARLNEHDTPYRVIPNFVPRRDNQTINDAGRFPEKFILFVGDVTQDKGVDVLIRAHAALDSPPPLFMIGRVEEPKAVSGAHDGVRLLGPLPHEDVLAALRRCMLAVVPSVVNEAFGLVALEALEAGRPLIASRTGGLGEIVVNGASGILVRPNDVDELRMALTRVLADDDLRARLSAGARARAEMFRAERVVPQFEEMYEQVIRKRC